MLLWRERVHYARSPGLLIAHLVVSLLLAFWIGVIYFRVPNDLAGFQNRAGAVFFTLTSFGFGSLSALETFIGDRPLLRKEVHRYFRPLPYFVVKVFVDFALLRIVPTLIYGTIVYW